MAAKIIRPSIEFLRSCFDYNPATGALIWKARATDQFKTLNSCGIWHSRFCGKAAGSLDNKGYRTICLQVDGKKQSVKAHVVAWALSYGAWPERYVDHVNGMKDDNRLTNLRKASTAENARNRGPTRANKTGLKGVTFTANGKRFRAQIKGEDSRVVYLGTFSSAEAAHSSYSSAARRLHGEFARNA